MTSYRWGKGATRIPLDLAKSCIHLYSEDVFALQGKRKGKSIRSRYRCGDKPSWRGESDTVHVSRTCGKCGKWEKTGGITRRMFDLFLAGQKLLAGPPFVEARVTDYQILSKMRNISSIVRKMKGIRDDHDLTMFL